MSVSYWAYWGILYLLILTYQDLTNNMRVDGRKNFFMMGITVSLFSHITDLSIIYIISLVLIVLLLFVIINKFKILGKADATTITWAFLGFGILGPYYLAWWGIIFIIGNLVYYAIKYLLYRKNFSQPTAYYPVILVAYTLTVLVFGII